MKGSDWLRGRPQGRTLADRFAEKHVVADSGCWEWIAGRFGGPNGRYGSFSVKKTPVLAHRMAYELFKGPIPPGLQIDHLCRNTICVNPDHLEAVTPRVNVHRSLSPVAANARKTHCIQGHPLSGSNLYVPKPGVRSCRACRRLSDRRIKAKAKAKIFPMRFRRCRYCAAWFFVSHHRKAYCCIDHREMWNNRFGHKVTWRQRKKAAIS
jgi:hypothetical protein